MSIQIFILSKLMEDNTYPYKLKKELSEPIPLDRLSNLTESKLYYHFDALAKKGLVEVVEVIREEHRPDKQVFRITAKGKEELPKLIYKQFEEAKNVTDMVVAIANIAYVDRHRVIGILERKREEILTHIEQTKGFEKQFRDHSENSMFEEFMSGYVSTKNDHTIFWLEELIRHIKSGAI